MNAASRAVTIRSLFLIALVAGAAVGIAIGFFIWSPGASNYSLVATSTQYDRFFTRGNLVFRYQVVVFVKSGGTGQVTLTLQNGGQAPASVTINYQSEGQSSLDIATINLLGQTHTQSVSAGNSVDYNVPITPSQTGYGEFMININGAATGNYFIVYSLPSSP